MRDGREARACGHLKSILSAIAFVGFFLPVLRRAEALVLEARPFRALPLLGAAFV